MIAAPAAPVPPPTLRVLPEHSMVRLRQAMPAEQLEAGAEGAVVHVYEGGSAYEVEFLAGRSRLCLVTLLARDVEPVR